MADRNITEVYLLNVPLENDYRNTIWFPDPATQESYFLDESRVKKVYTDFSYLRKDGIIRVDVDYDSVVSLGCNYVAYRNKAYSNKWFYAFITNIEYKNEGRTDIHIETDVMQTWLFNHTVQASYIEREHCFDDTIGANTQPEDLETGEYVINLLDEYGINPDTNKGTGVLHFEPLTRMGLVVASTVDATGDVTYTKDTLEPNGEEVEVPVPFPACGGSLYGGVFSGVKYFYFPITTNVETGATGFINKLAATGQSDAIHSIFLFPVAFLELSEEKPNEIIGTRIPKTLLWSDGELFDDEWMENLPDTDTLANTIIKPSSLDGYKKIRNRKLLTYPYCYLMVTNNAGSDTVYEYELFDTNVCTFQIDGTVTPGGSIRLTPKNYARTEENYSKSLTGGKFPICSWYSDVYTNWLTQNSLNMEVAQARGINNINSALLNQITGVTESVLGSLKSAFSYDVFGAGAGGASILNSYMGGEIAKSNGWLDIASVIAQRYQHSLTPPESRGNLNNGDVTYAMGMLTFSAYHMSIKAEYACIIDKYFDMYGYATNLVKEPYENHRESYWFTKTIAANVDAAIPNADLNIIKRCYNNGITFWRHTKTVGDYTQSNNIVK